MVVVAGLRLRGSVNMPPNYPGVTNFVREIVWTLPKSKQTFHKSLTLTPFDDIIKWKAFGDVMLI
jgi:hypothetical protein